MGEVADMIINGKQCSWCEVIFVEDHDYPVLCEDCYNDSTEYERVGLQKAEFEEI